MENISSTNEIPQPSPTASHFAKASRDESAGTATSNVASAKSPKNSICILLAIIFVIVLVFFFAAKKPQEKQTINPQEQNQPKEYTKLQDPPKNEEFSAVTRWEYVMPDILKKTYPQTAYAINGVNYIREYAIIKETIQPKEIYTVTLLKNRNEAIVSLDNNTLIAHGLFGYDAKGDLITIQYHRFQTIDLEKLKIGDTVLISHEDTNKVSTNQLLLSEFVMME